MDLFGETPEKPGKAEKLAKAKKKADAVTKRDQAVQRCIDAFYECYVRKWNDPSLVRLWAAAEPAERKKMTLATPVVHGGKHGRKFKEFLAAWGEDVVLGLVRQFFETTDPQVTRTDYTYDAFFRLAPHLVLARSRRRPQVSDRTRANLDAAARAVGRHK